MTKDRAPGASSPTNEKGGENHMQTETVQNIPALELRQVKPFEDILREALEKYRGRKQQVVFVSHILNGHRPMPEDFEAQVHTALDRLEAAEKAAQKERERVLAE